MLYTTLSPDFYTLLHIPRDASPNDIKIAYHRTLLRLHPDKRSQSQSRPRHHDSNITAANVDPPPPEEAPVDMALVKEAYRTLSDAGLRAAYDSSLRREERARSYGPRPAQVVSFEEFTAVHETTEVGSPGRGPAEAEEAQEWWHGCRCGGTYRITQDDLENGTHLVGCESCSEVIWVGYEEAQDEGE
ncbi:DnaJ domain containing protein [Tylopilus felleus]